MRKSETKQRVTILYNVPSRSGFFRFFQQVWAINYGKSSFPITLISDQDRALRYVGVVIAGVIKTHHVSFRVHQNKTKTCIELKHALLLSKHVCCNIWAIWEMIFFQLTLLVAQNGVIVVFAGPKAMPILLKNLRNFILQRMMFEMQRNNRLHAGFKEKKSPRAWELTESPV